MESAPRVGVLLRLAAMGLCCAIAAGCSLSPNNRLTVFPEAQRLLESADAMRNAAPRPVPVPRELDKRVLTAYVVEPGDVLLMHPADMDSPIRVPADQPVLPDGTINLGRYGQLVVAGHTVPEIEGMVHAAIAAQVRDAGPFIVRIGTRQSKVYYVLGEVNAPGAFPLLGRETVLDGIMAAGGLTDRAARDRIILARPTPPDHCRLVLPVCYREMVQLGDTTTNYQLAPGDRIFVPTRGCWDGFLKKSENECGPCHGVQLPCDCGASGAEWGPRFVSGPDVVPVPAVPPAALPLVVPNSPELPPPQPVEAGPAAPPANRTIDPVSTLPAKEPEPPKPPTVIWKPAVSHATPAYFSPAP